MLTKIIQAIFGDRDGYIGRKLVAAWSLTTLLNILIGWHLLWNLWFDTSSDPLLSGEQYIQGLTVIWAGYFASDAANTWAYSFKKNNNSDNSNNEGSREG